MVGVQSARPRRGRPGRGAVLPQTLPDTSAVAVRHAVQFRTPADTLPHPARSAGAVLQKHVAKLAAAGGMQPAPVGASKPYGQPARSWPRT
jgi:hypothetical protein